MTVYNFMANPPIIKSSDISVLMVSLVRSLFFFFIKGFLEYYENEQTRFCLFVFGPVMYMVQLLYIIVLIFRKSKNPKLEHMFSDNKDY